MDNLASLQTIYPIVLSIVVFIITWLLFRKGSFFLRKPTSLVLLVGDLGSSVKHLRASDDIFASDDTLEDFHQWVHVPSLNQETLERLLVSHPSVTHLTLSVSRLTVLAATGSLLELCDLLDGWKSTLQSLKLILHFRDLRFNDYRREMAPSGASDLLRVINQGLTCLEHLTLSSNTRLLPHDHYHLTVLRRLRSFTLDTKDPVSWLTRSFTSCATLNPKLEFIQMENAIDAEDAYLALTGVLWSKFTHLNVGNWEIDPGVLFPELPLMAVFPFLLGLKYLSLGAHFQGSNQYPNLMATLAVLTQLTTLDLQVTSDGGITLQEEEEAQVLPVLANIKQLSLNITSVDHEVNQVDLFYIDTIFPRLDCLMVHFDAQSCEDDACGYDPDGTPVLAHVMQYCASQLYQQVRPVSVARKEVTFQWKEPRNIWTLAQLAIPE